MWYIANLNEAIWNTAIVKHWKNMCSFFIKETVTIIACFEFGIICNLKTAPLKIFPQHIFTACMLAYFHLRWHNTTGARAFLVYTSGWKQQRYKWFCWLSYSKAHNVRRGRATFWSPQTSSISPFWTKRCSQLDFTYQWNSMNLSE